MQTPVDELEQPGDHERRRDDGDSDEADRIALIRTLIVGVNFITCFFIMANTIRHW